TPRPIDAVEAFEDAFEVAGRNTNAVIANNERHAVAVDARTDLDAVAGTGVLDRVVEQVDDGAAQLARVAHNLHVGRFWFDADRHVRGVGGTLHEVDALRDEHAHRYRFARGSFLRFDRRKIEEIVDHLRQAIDFAYHSIGELLHDAHVVRSGH